MKKALIILLFFGTMATYAQKKPVLEVYEDVVEAATKELSEAMKPPEGALHVFKTENNISGEYIFDITVHEKGTVASVFAAGNEGGTIQSQNKLKDFIKDYQFNFKMPKGKDYKFQYIFKFD